MDSKMDNDNNNNCVKLILTDPENDTSYELFLTPEEHERALTDELFAQTLFNNAKREADSHTTNTVVDEMSENESEDQQCQWKDSATKYLLSLYKDKKILVERGKIKTLKKMYELISKEMALHGYNFSPTQIENKWKTLERAYKNHILNKKKTGRGRKVFAYYEELAEILEKRHSINPPVVISSLTPEICASTSTNDGSTSNIATEMDITEDGEILTPHKPKKRRTEKDNITEEIKELKKAIVERHKAKEIAEKRKLQQRDDFLEQLKIKNQLLQKLLDRS